MSGLLAGRTVTITGAGSSVGQALEALVLAHGADVVAVDRDLARLRADSDPARRRAVEADLTSAAACEAAVAAATAAGRPIDALCNTFGIDPPGAGRTVDTSEADWDRIMTVNLKAVFLICRAVLPGMAARRAGAIVNVASQAAIRALPNMTAYGVSKAGVVQLTRQIASDHAADNVRANCVCPSGLEQPSQDRLAVLGPEALARRQAAMQRVAPMGRVCTPDDVAGAMLFLASDLAAYVTGAAVPVEGGVTAMLRF